MDDTLLTVINDELAKLTAENSRLTRELRSVKLIRKKLSVALTQLKLERDKRTRAIEQYNREVQKIVERSGSLKNLLNEALPSVCEQLPHLIEPSTSEESYKQLLDRINQAAINIHRSKERASGIYFLLQDNELVYIGQSNNCGRRIYDHLTENVKAFNRACYLPIDEADLSDIESALINVFRPKLNRQFGRDYDEVKLRSLGFVPLFYGSNKAPPNVDH